MIDNLYISNFKRFPEISLDLAPMTLLTGLNGGGKSSIIQALLLLHSEVLPGGAMPLNGPFGLALGEAKDVLNSSALNNEIIVEARCDGERSSLVASVPYERSPSLLVESLTIGALASLRNEVRAFEYLCAERLGPRDLQEVSPRFEDELSVGSRGEFTAHVLSQLGQDQVPEPRWCPVQPGGDSRIITLRSQTEAWLATILGPIQIEARWVPGTSAATLRFKSPDILTDWLRPMNVGFGVSFALPIVVAALAIAEGGLLIVENPEAHLHPAGQSAMGRFLGRVAAAGVQVIVESHSDHLFSGIRHSVAVERILDAGDVAIHYFGADGARSVTLDPRGSVSAWPDGFFDQTERDLAELARAKSSR